MTSRALFNGTVGCEVGKSGPRICRLLLASFCLVSTAPSALAGQGVLAVNESRALVTRVAALVAVSAGSVANAPGSSSIDAADGVPVITAQPTRTRATGSVTLVVSASSASAMTFRWQVTTGGGVWTNVSDDGTHTGAGTATLVVANAALLPQTSSYRVVIANASGQVVNLPAPLRTMPGLIDVDGDRQSDLVVFRPSTGEWLTKLSSAGYLTGGGLSRFQWGTNGDWPLQVDFDGDGRMDPTVFRPSTGQWFVLYSGHDYDPATPGVFEWGTPEDFPVPADFDGDGKADLAVYRPSTGYWYIRHSSTGYPVGEGNWIFQWGTDGDQPLTADFDGDGRPDIGLFRPSSSQFFIRHSSLDYSGSRAWFLQGGAGTAGYSLVDDFDGDGKADAGIVQEAGSVFIAFSSRNYDNARPLYLLFGNTELRIRVPIRSEIRRAVAVVVARAEAFDRTSCTLPPTLPRVERVRSGLAPPRMSRCRFIHFAQAHRTCRLSDSVRRQSCCNGDRPEAPTATRSSEERHRAPRRRTRGRSAFPSQTLSQSGPPITTRLSHVTIQPQARTPSPSVCMPRL